MNRNGFIEARESGFFSTRVKKRAEARTLLLFDQSN